MVILTAQLMVVLDTTIVNVALPHIQRGLHFSASGLSWVLNAYILTFGGLLLLGARAGDLLGRRRAFLTGIAAFSISSLLGGVAGAAWMLLAARAIQGVGAALAAPSALSLLTTAFAEGAARDRAIGLYTTVSAAGGATGLVLGGLLTELVSWRWVMFVNVPIGVAIWFLGRVVLTETTPRHGRFDLIGAMTSTVGMSAIVFGLIESGSAGWADLRTLGAFAVGVVLLLVFVRTERRHEEPILPLRLLSHPARTTANGARGLVYAGMYGTFFFMSQFLQDILHYSPLRAGVAFLPLPAAVFLSSQLTGRVLVQRFAQKTVMLSGISLVALSLITASRLHIDNSYAVIFVILVLLGAGSGISFVSLTSASLHQVPPSDAGAASGLVNVTQQIGAALGLAVLVTVFGTVTHHAQIGAQAGGLVMHGLHVVFGVGLVFCVAAMLTVAALIPRTPRPAPVIELDVEPSFGDEPVVDVA
jgi:EmrB/QacA subfamily drug resistance transporter